MTSRNAFRGGKYSRTLLQSVVQPESSDPSGTDPYYSILDGQFIQFIRSLRTGERHTVVQVEIGDLPRIAWKYYRNINGWWIIGQYNGIVDPWLDMYPGQVLEIPSLDSINDYFRTVDESYRSKKGASIPKTVDFS